MIKHTIQRYKERTVPHLSIVPINPPAPVLDRQVPALFGGIRLTYGKYAYAQFINKIKLRKGDYVLRRNTVLYPLIQGDVWKVNNIQEIHWMCAGQDTGILRPIEIIDKEGNREWHAEEFLIPYVGNKEFQF